MPSPTPFERDTAIEPIGNGTYRATITHDWWVIRGPNGGYLAAIILRAIQHAVADDTRAPRSLTVHYMTPPDEGEVTVTTQIERQGRSMTSCTARMHQGDVLVAVAIAACSKPREGPVFNDLTMPAVPRAADLERPPMIDEAPPIARRWDIRWALGVHPFSGERSEVAEGGAWARLEHPQPLDAPAIAALADALVPPVFARSETAMVVPTVDLTVHFRSTLPHPGMAADDFALAVFRTNVAAGGFMEEDGEIWAPDGTLLAQSRQLAAIFPAG